jgi:hypothetical protein
MRVEKYAPVWENLLRKAGAAGEVILPMPNAARLKQAKDKMKGLQAAVIREGRGAHGVLYTYARRAYIGQSLGCLVVSMKRHPTAEQIAQKSIDNEIEIARQLADLDQMMGEVEK